MRQAFVAVGFCSVVLLHCGGDFSMADDLPGLGDDASESGQDDSNPAETGTKIDSAAPDTGNDEDTALDTSEDVSAPDTSVDSTVVDAPDADTTPVVDTGVKETSVGDTGTTDTGKKDTGVSDTAPDVLPDAPPPDPCLGTPDGSVRFVIRRPTGGSAVKIIVFENHEDYHGVISPNSTWGVRCSSAPGAVELICDVRPASGAAMPEHTSIHFRTGLATTPLGPTETPWTKLGVMAPMWACWGPLLVGRFDKGAFPVLVAGLNNAMSLPPESPPPWSDTFYFSYPR